MPETLKINFKLYHIKDTSIKKYVIFVTNNMANGDKIYRLLHYKNLLVRLKSIGFVKVF